jgi:hypothetical protein
MNVFSKISQNFLSRFKVSLDSSNSPKEKNSSWMAAVFY